MIAYPEGIDKNASYRNATKLLMFDNGKGGYNTFVMRIMPDITSVFELEKNTYNKKTNSFTGDIIYYTWEGKPLVRTHYKNGKRTERNHIKQTSKKQGLNGSRTNECYSIEIEWCQIVCYAGYCGEPTYLYSDYYYFCGGSYDDDNAGPGDLGGGGYGDNGGSGDSSNQQYMQQALNDLLQFYPAALLEIPCDQVPKWQSVAQKQSITTH